MPELLKNNAESLFAWTKSRKQQGNATTESLGGLSSRKIEEYFWDFLSPMPVLDSSDNAQEDSSFSIPKTESFYSAYVDAQGDLIFAYESHLPTSPERVKHASVRYLPSEVDHLLKGIIYQAATGLGRTPANKLTRIVEHYLSHYAMR